MGNKIASVLITLLLAGTSLSAQRNQVLACGDIVTDEVISGQSNVVRNNVSVEDYKLEVPAGTYLDLVVKPLGTTFNVAIVLLDSGGNDVHIANETASGGPEVLSHFQIASSNPTLRILGVQPAYLGTVHFYSNGNGGAGKFFGGYEIQLGCTTSEGDVVIPGQPRDSIQAGDPALAAFSGFGFPGVGVQDFSAGIELPLVAGQPVTVPVGGDVALYNYEASSDERRTLSVSRFSGTISIGVTVTKRDTNEIIFFGGMPASDRLSVELAFPSDGVYVVGVFRVDTAERIGTTGAVEIKLE